MKLIAGKPMALIGKKKIDILHSPAQKVGQFDEEILSLASRMYGTVLERGHAIAANQVGIPLNLIVLDNGQGYINIQIEEVDDETEIGVEGCLSLPGRHFVVPRFKKIKLVAQDLMNMKVEEEKEDFEARMWQHEYDHLRGELISEQGYQEIKRGLQR